MTISDLQLQRPHGSPRAGPIPLRIEDYLPFQLTVCSTLISQGLAGICSSRHQLSLPEWRVLATLSQYGTMTAKAVGKFSQMHKTKVSRAVALLEQRKLVSRRANRADMREAFLSLTAAGRDICDDLAPLALEFARRLSEAVDTPDRLALDRALAKLNERATKLAADIAKRPDDR